MNNLCPHFKTGLNFVHIFPINRLFFKKLHIRKKAQKANPRFCAYFSIISNTLLYLH